MRAGDLKQQFAPQRLILRPKAIGSWSAGQVTYRHLGRHLRQRALAARRS